MNKMKCLQFRIPFICIYKCSRYRSCGENFTHNINIFLYPWIISRCLYRKYPFKLYFNAYVHLQLVHIKSEIEVFISLRVALIRWAAGVYLQWNSGVHIKSEIEGFISISTNWYKSNGPSIFGKKYVSHVKLMGS